MSHSLEYVQSLDVQPVDVPPWDANHIPIVLLGTERRARFILRTYSHLLVAMVGFAGIEIFLFRSSLVEPILHSMFGLPWLVILAGFMMVGWLASRTASRASSLTLQYTALASFVVVEALMFLPFLSIAEAQMPGVIGNATVITMAGFIGLTGVVFVTRKDFSFLNGMLLWAAVVALLLIITSFILGFELRAWFSVAMIAVAGGCILRDTSRILRYYPEGRYVGAALELFASVSLLFWYVLQFMMRRR